MLAVFLWDEKKNKSSHSMGTNIKEKRHFNKSDYLWDCEVLPCPKKINSKFYLIPLTYFHEITYISLKYFYLSVHTFLQVPVLKRVKPFPQEKW